MAPPGYIQALMIHRDKSPASREDIPTVTEPFLPYILPLINQSNMCHTYFIFLGEYGSKPVYLPLPDIHPSRPKQWTEEAWNQRLIHGDTNFHVLSTPGENDRFLLWVSQKESHGEKLVYEDFDPRSTLWQGTLDCLGKEVMRSLETKAEFFGLRI